MILETVKICHPKRGWVIINKIDFDPEKHTLYGEEVKPEPVEKPARKRREV